MKICVAQIKPRTGDIEWNIERHKKVIDRAVSHNAEMIIFPELSLTGYEPKLAKKLSTTKNDSRFDIFQTFSNSHQIIICIGAPLQLDQKVSIGMVIFQPQKERVVYHKKYLHSDEEAFFVSGPNLNGLLGKNTDISLAICYELSIPQYAKQAHEAGAKIYIASVAKHKNNIGKATQTLSNISNEYSMMTMMSNCIGKCDGDICFGNSAIWNTRGEMLSQLDETHEGIIIIDTESEQIINEKF